MHLAGSPGSYFAYLKDCLEEWSGGLRVGWGSCLKGSCGSEIP